MIRNLLYSLSLHLLLVLVVYLNFNFQEFIEFPSDQPITVSFVSLKEVESTEIKKEESVASEEKQIIEEPKKEVVKPKKVKKKKKPKKKPKKKVKKKIKKKDSKRKSLSKSKKAPKDSNKKLIVKERIVNKNVEKAQTINFSARERFNVELQIKRCYKDAIRGEVVLNKIPIKIKVSLRLNGSVNLKSLKVLNEAEYKNSASGLDIALRNSRKALRRCSPLRNLPKDKYEIWKEIDVVFDPNV